MKLPINNIIRHEVSNSKHTKYNKNIPVPTVQNLFNLRSCTSTFYQSVFGDLANYGLSWAVLTGTVASTPKESWVFTKPSSSWSASKIYDSDPHIDMKSSNQVDQVTDYTNECNESKHIATYKSGKQDDQGVSLFLDMVTNEQIDSFEKVNDEGSKQTMFNVKPSNVPVGPDGSIGLHCLKTKTITTDFDLITYDPKIPSTWNRLCPGHTEGINQNEIDGSDSDTSCQLKETALPCFNLTRDYTIEQEGFEDWSWLDDISAVGTTGRRPYDTIVRDNLPMNTFSDNAEDNLTQEESEYLSKIWDESMEITTDYLQEEHLMSHEVSNNYATQLRVKQRMKWWYGLSGSESYTSKNDLKSLTQLEERMDRLLWKHNWFSSLAEARQALQHGHIKILRKRDIDSYMLKMNLSKDGKWGSNIDPQGPNTAYPELLTLGKQAKPSTLVNKGDFIYWKASKINSFWNKRSVATSSSNKSTWSGLNNNNVKSADWKSIISQGQYNDNSRIFDSNQNYMDTKYSTGVMNYNFPVSVHLINPEGVPEELSKFNESHDDNVVSSQLEVFTFTSPGLSLFIPSNDCESLLRMEVPSKSKFQVPLSSDILVNHHQYPYSQRSYKTMCSDLVLLPQSLI